MAVSVNLKAYFDRIGFAGSIAPTVATLENLQALHPASIPFENIDPLIGANVLLDQSSLERKLLADRRGGYCLEHNLLFMRVLEDLDYVVRPLLARVLWPDPEAASTEKTHLLLHVEVNGQSYIADVGFGGLTLTAPLRLRADVEQQTPHETFRLRNGEANWTLEAQIGEDWRPVYAFTLDEVNDAEIAAVNHEMSNNRSQRMTQELRVSLSPGGRRIKLHNTTLTVQPVEGDAEKRETTTMESLRAALTGEFGIQLPNDERLEPALAALLPAPAEPPEA
ncbi:MAG: arylamine N-acetyltransferase [Phyllobacteriaceae bacterium]|nr:arylamine N-acetyltransferase [Phyllobacteriaceae bacterium]